MHEKARKERMTLPLLGSVMEMVALGWWRMLKSCVEHPQGTMLQLWLTILDTAQLLPAYLLVPGKFFMLQYI